MGRQMGNERRVVRCSQLYRYRGRKAGMGLVMTKVKLTNFLDAEKARSGLIAEAEIRSVDIEALVDMGAINLAIPQDVADHLGLPVLRHRPVRVADGRSIEVVDVGPLRIEVVGRDMISEAIVLPAGTMPLLGAIQMEYLDLIVSPATGEAIARDPKEHLVLLLRAG
jgi:clan AA aspartic protease